MHTAPEYQWMLIMPNLNVPILCNIKTDSSYFMEQQYCLDDYNGLFISSRQEALNFRHRMSEPGYFSDWHVAGDPTLIIIRLVFCASVYGITVTETLPRVICLLHKIN
jgi:hypothetical protein